MAWRQQAVLQALVPATQPVLPVAAPLPARALVLQRRAYAPVLALQVLEQQPVGPRLEQRARA